MGRFGPREHAVLFAMAARSAGATSRKAAELAIIEAVMRYARQRGLRMRKRALMNGDGLSMASYKTYCEWQAEEGSIIQRTIQESPVLVTHTLKCPWNDAWKDAGMLPEGRIYCSCVDESLVEGFNEDLHLEMGEVLTCGVSQFCEFRWNGIDLSREEDRLMLAKRAEIVSTAVKSWDYHIGHLYRQLSDTLRELLPGGVEVMTECRRQFVDMYGEDAASILDASESVDYNLP